MRLNSTVVALAAIAIALLAASPAEAKCTRLAFSVNDYGKDGPTKDAKALLDKYIAQWTAERGIKKYTTGKKDVSCELFLDFVVFDEHTCKAAATVCWGDGQPVQAKAGDAVPAAAATPAPAVKAKAAAPQPAPVATGTLPVKAPVAVKPAAAAAPASAAPPAASPALTPPPKTP